MSEKIDGDFIIGSLTLAFNNKLKNILLDISSSYNIDSAKLINKYCNNNINAGDLAISIKKKKGKKNRILGKDELCMAEKSGWSSMYETQKRQSRILR